MKSATFRLVHTPPSGGGCSSRTFSCFKNSGFRTQGAGPPRPERVVARQQLLDPARHKTRQRRHRRDRVALRQKPDRLVVPRRARILTRAITLLQLLNAEMIRYMRHDPPSRDSWRSNLTASHPKRNPTRVNQPETV